MREFCDGVLIATMFVCIIFMVVSAIFYFQSHDEMLINAFWFGFTMFIMCIIIVWM